MNKRLSDTVAILAWLAVLAPSVLLRVYPAYPIAADEKVFAVVARRVAEGAVLYREVFDHKGPALYWLFDLLTRLAGGSYLGVRIGTIVASLALQIAVYLVVQRVTRDRVAAFYAAFAIGIGAWVTNRIFGVELWMAAGAGVALAFLVCSRRPSAALLAGALTGFGVMVRPTGLLEVGVLLVIAAWMTQGPKVLRSGAFLFGFLLSSAYFLLPTFLAGAYVEAYYALIEFNSYYSQQMKLDGALIATLALWIGRQVVICFFLWLPAAGSIFVRCIDADLRRWRAVLILWTASAMFCALLGKRPFNHYLLQPYLPMSILAGISVSILPIKLPRLSFSRVALGASVWLLVLGAAGWFHATHLRAPQLAYANAERRVAQLVDRMTKPEDKLYVWGNATNVYYFSRRAPATPYLYYPPFRGPDRPEASGFERDYWSKWAICFDAGRPRVVVDASATAWNDLPWLPLEANRSARHRIFHSYRLLAELDGFRMYVRSDRQAAQAR